MKEQSGQSEDLLMSTYIYDLDAERQLNKRYHRADNKGTLSSILNT